MKQKHTIIPHRRPSPEAEEKEKKMLPFWAKWAIGYAAVPFFSIGLVYFWRVAFLAEALPALSATLMVMGVCTLLYATLFLLVRFYDKKPCLRAALCTFAIGLLFCFFTAPLQAPDEDRHFFRAYAVSMGHFDYSAGRDYPDDADFLLQYFPNAMNHKIKYDAGLLVPQRLAQYHTALQTGEPAQVQVAESIQFMAVPYLAQAAFMATARLFGASALGMMYAGRIANLLCYTIICYFVFRNCSKYRGIFYAAALLPLSLFMAASCSTDSLALAFCYLAVSYFCKAKIETRDVVCFALAVGVSTYLKFTSIALAPVLLLIPEARWNSKWNPRRAVLLLLAGTLLAYQGLGMLNNFNAASNGFVLSELPRGVGEGSSPSLQIQSILSNPFAFFPRLLLTFIEEDAFLFGLGTLGWLDLTLPLVGGLSLLSLASSSALGIQQKEDTKSTGAWALLLASVFYIGAVMLALFVTHSQVGSIRITGLQPRYFLPAFLMLFMLGSIVLGKAVRPRLSAQATMLRTENISLCIAAAIALLAALLLFQSYFIGQWIPKAEGGWKLVNLFGWRQL